MLLTRKTKQAVSHQPCWSTWIGHPSVLRSGGQTLAEGKIPVRVNDILTGIGQRQRQAQCVEVVVLGSRPTLLADQISAHGQRLGVSYLCVIANISHPTALPAVPDEVSGGLHNHRPSAPEKWDSFNDFSGLRGHSILATLALPRQLSPATSEPERCLAGDRTMPSVE